MVTLVTGDLGAKGNEKGVTGVEVYLETGVVSECPHIRPLRVGSVEQRN